MIVLVLVALFDPQSGTPAQVQQYAIWLTALAAGMVAIMTIHRQLLVPTVHGVAEAYRDLRQAARTVMSIPERLDRLDQRSDAVDERLERMDARLQLLTHEERLERHRVQGQDRTGWRE
jgi:hypothetical protein